MNTMLSRTGTSLLNILGSSKQLKKWRSMYAIVQGLFP